jgi:Nucleotidyltransferase domain
MLLSDRIDDVEAVLLFGSVARGDAGNASDIDLLVVTKNPVKRQDLASEIPADASPIFHTWDSLQRAREMDWSFFVHLREEGVPVEDREGRLGQALVEVKPPSPQAARASLEQGLAYLKTFEKLDRFGSSYRFALARIYVLAKRTCMEDNTTRNVVAFSRKSAFAAFGEHHESIRDEVDWISGLWPFAATAQGRRPSLPTDRDNEAALRRAVAGTRKILSAARGS